MSGVGPTNIGGLNLAGSFAGAQRSTADSDRVVQEGAQRTHPLDARSLAARGLDGVVEPELSSDRDPDGRLSEDALPPEERTKPERKKQNAADDHTPATHRAADANNERGLRLDLEA